MEKSDPNKIRIVIFKRFEFLQSKIKKIPNNSETMKWKKNSRKMICDVNNQSCCWGDSKEEFTESKKFNLKTQYKKFICSGKLIIILSFKPSFVF